MSPMSADKPREYNVSVNSLPCRVWERGVGPSVGFFPGIGGLPRWTPFLETLSRQYKVTVPSLPGFPGANGHRDLDDHLDWLLATRDLVQASGLLGADIIAASVAGALLADAAAVWPDLVRRLILIAPFGLFDVSDPVADIWAQRPNSEPELLCSRKENYAEVFDAPVGGDAVEWDIVQGRASEAAARFLFPFGETGLRRRLHRISRPVLVIRGGKDKVIPESQARLFASLVGPSCSFASIPDAGHLAELDQPEEVARVVKSFLDS